MADGSLIRDAYQAPFNETLQGRLLNYLLRLGIDQAVNQINSSGNPVRGAGQVFGDGPAIGSSPDLSQSRFLTLGSNEQSGGSAPDVLDKNFRYLGRSPARNP
ncbi:hypothetical protein ACVINW_004857 [Bradyrhizobium sp. USDA 4461]